MSQKCKTLEEKGKTLLKTEPLKAKDEFISAAECYNKNFKKKEYQKLIIKAAKIVEDHAKPLNPFKAKQFCEEAYNLYKKVEEQDKAQSVMVSLGNKFIESARLIEKNNVNLVEAIIHYLAAEEVFLEYDEEQKYHDCTIAVYNICVAIGVPLGRIAKFIKAQAK